MAEDSAGVGAEVGVRKRNAEGEVTQEEGYVKGQTTVRGWLIFLVLTVLSAFGIWQILELLAIL